MKPDPRIAALAEALEAHGAAHPDPFDKWEWASCGVDCAATVLAALPDDWCGHAGWIPESQRQVLALRIQTLEEEIASLRKIKETARALIPPHPRAPESAKVRALRAALEEKP